MKRLQKLHIVHTVRKYGEVYIFIYFTEGYKNVFIYVRTMGIYDYQLSNNRRGWIEYFTKKILYVCSVYLYRYTDVLLLNIFQYGNTFFFSSKIFYWLSDKKLYSLRYTKGRILVRPGSKNLFLFFFFIALLKVGIVFMSIVDTIENNLNKKNIQSFLSRLIKFTILLNFRFK